MTQLYYRFFCLIMGIFFISINNIAQTVNFDETWKEFLENNKISNMSALNKPSKYDDPLNYIKYLLMNTNNSFCQSEIDKAETLMAEIKAFDPRAPKAVPRFVKKMEDLETKIKAYHSMEAIWKQFLQTRAVDLEDLESIEAAKTSCEKRTLAKYSYMTVYYHFCRGDVSRAKNILENRTLRLTEKTSLRVEDVEGLAPEVAKMKALFQNMSKLEANWKNYMETGISPGFNEELPLFPCYPIPNMKEWVLKGAADVCNSGSMMLEKIKKLQTESGVAPDGELTEKVKELEAAIEQKEANLSVLNEAWERFIATNEVKSPRKYGYEYCGKEPLIRAYIMDGFANACGNAEEMLQKIDFLQNSETIALTEVTMAKINELTGLHIRFQYDEEEINRLWGQFVTQGDTLYGDYQLADYYCDHIYDVKSWVIQGLSGTCKEGRQYLEQIDGFKKTLEFEFTQDVKCRVNKLRIKVWDCQHEALRKLAHIQAPDSFEERLEELMKEYGIGERPEICFE